MSRTYRTFMLDLDKNHKPFPVKRMSFEVWCREYPGPGEFSPVDYFTKQPSKVGKNCWRHNQKCDKKPWYKPTKEYKRLMARNRRAKEKQSMKNKNYDNVPKFKKTDVWNWT